jgi:hypothetical protein
MNNNAKIYRFVLVLSGFSYGDDNIEDALFEAGCDDALLIFRNNVPYLEFDRLATNLDEAIYSSIQDVESANIGATVLRIYNDDDTELMNSKFLYWIRAQSRQKDILSILDLRFNPQIAIHQQIEQYLSSITDDAKLDKLLTLAVKTDNINKVFQQIIPSPNT